MQRPSGGRKGTLHKVIRLEKQQVRAGECLMNLGKAEPILESIGI